MIEGINASIASAALVRPVVDQVERVASYAANPEQVQRVAAPPYLSLYVSMNVEIDKAVLQFRDADSGDVLAQIPSEKQIKAYRKAATEQPAIYKPKADAVEAQAAVVAPAPEVSVQETAPVADTSGSDTGESTSTSVEITA